MHFACISTSSIIYNFNKIFLFKIFTKVIVWEKDFFLLDAPHPQPLTAVVEGKLQQEGIEDCRLTICILT